MSEDQPVVVLLGAGMGGRGVAAALSGSARLVVVDRDRALAERALTVSGATGEAESVDLLDLAAVTTFRDDVLARHGRVDAVVHLVGGWQGSKTVDKRAIEQWDALVPGIVRTVQTTSVAFRDALLAAPAGRYVMVTSTAVDRPTAGNAAYASAKAAAETWVKALGHSFRDSDARAVIVAVKALVNDDMRAADPAKTFPGYTDTRALGDTVAALLNAPSTGSGTEEGTATRILGPTVES